MANAEKDDFLLFQPELGRFFTSFSRETRNPLQSIWGALSVIQRRADPGDEYLSRAVGIIGEELGQLNELIQDYLEFVRPTKSDHFAPVDLNLLLSRVLAIVHHHRRGSPVSLSLSLDPALPQLSGNYDEIKRAFLHVIKDSYRALSKDGGNLVVETRFSPTPEPGSIRIAFALCPGVAGEDGERPAPPPSGSPHPAGGLGMAIGRRIIAEHCRGKLEAERVPGEGLRFLVSLPVNGVPAHGYIPEVGP